MLKRFQLLRTEKGFTLVELLVVVTILGVLSAVAVIAVGGSAVDSKRSACKSDVATVQAAADSFVAKNGSVAASVEVLTTEEPPFLRSAPTNDAYTVTLDEGEAVASPACEAIA